MFTYEEIKVTCEIKETSKRENFQRLSGEICFCLFKRNEMRQKLLQILSYKKFEGMNCMSRTRQINLSLLHHHLLLYTRHPSGFPQTQMKWPASLPCSIPCPNTLNRVSLLLSQSGCTIAAVTSRNGRKTALSNKNIFHCPPQIHTFLCFQNAYWIKNRGEN